MKSNKKGLALVELIVVIAILAVLTVIVVPRFKSYTEKAREQVCNTNRNELDRMYNMYLVIEDINHTEKIFEEYFRRYWEDICPKDGSISYDNGQVKCSIHFKGSEDEEEVPYL